MSIRLSTFVKQSSEQLSCPLNQEVAVLNLKNTIYYSLEGIGPFVWEQLMEKKTVENICSAVAKRFEVEVAQCEEDVIEFLNELARAGLIDASNSL